MLYLEPLDARRLFAFNSTDDTFGGSGPLAPGADSQYVVPQRTLVQADGRIVVAGWSADQWALRRYMPDGSIDTSFGDDGIFKMGGKLKPSQTISVLTQGRDGGLFVGGDAKLSGEGLSPTSSPSVLIAKVTTGGSFDRSYLDGGASNVGRSGFFRVGMDSPFLDTRAESIKLERGGKLVVATGGGPGAIRFTRYDAEGRLDPTFANSGRMTRIDLSGVPAAILAQLESKHLSHRYAQGITSIAEAPDGSVVAAGFYVYSRPASGAFDGGVVRAYLPYLVRVSASGAVIHSHVFPPDFNADPKSNPDLSIIPRQMQIDSTGKIYMLDERQVVRLNADLTLDTTWGDDGVAAAVVTTPHGKLTAASLPQIIAEAEAKLLGVVHDPSRGAASAQPLAVLFNGNAAVQNMQLELATAEADASASSQSLRALALSVGETIGAAADPLAHAFLDNGQDEQLHGGSAAAVMHVRVHTRVIAASDDDDSDSPAPFANGNLRILDPEEVRLAARPTKKSDNANGPAPVGYQAGPAVDDADWASTDDGHYNLRLIGNRVADITGALAAGRTLGSFSVRVPEPVLQTTSVATAPIRERQLRLAPNH